MSKRSPVYNYEATSTFSPNRASLRWTIQNFSFCSLKGDENFRSPEFASANASWVLHIFPKSSLFGGMVAIYLSEIGTESEEKRVSYKISLQDKDGVDRYIHESQHVFSGVLSGVTFLIDREVLMKEKREELLPGDRLTVFCQLNSGCTLTHSSAVPADDREVVAAHLEDDSAVEKLVADFRRVLYDRKFCDVILFSSDGQRFPAHKSILEARSSVFSAMFQHDMKETRRGEVCIEDIEGSVLKQLLHYVYTAQLDDISSCDVPNLFVAAEKYDVVGLKKKCIRHLLNTMSPENVCDAIVLGDMFMEQELKESAKSFLLREASRVIPSHFWKDFVKQHAHLAVQMLEWILSIKNV